VTIKPFKFAAFALTAMAFAATAFARETKNFDSDWRFLPADAPRAEQIQFDDSVWRQLDVPHDWSIEGPFAETNKTGGAGAFLPSGVGWYRKHFTLPKDSSGRCVRVEFDGVMQNSDVWINGFHLGHRPSGYTSFSYELTGHLNFGGDNLLAVRADTSQQPASRWYSGAGIYRHVRLVVTDPVYFEQNGIFTSTPQVSAAQATVRVEISITNESAAACHAGLQISLAGPDGRTVCGATNDTSIDARTGRNIVLEFTVPKPRRWNLDDPKFYRVSGKIVSGGKTLDETTGEFGIRDAHFEADTGFWLNGKNFKLYGVCLHHDGGAFGAAVPPGVWEHRLAELKKLGVNAIRTAHNPPAPEFLDLCDRMGFLVMDEFFDCWTVGKNPSDYHLFFSEWSRVDARDAVRRDRNHPSVILYSVGNEIHDTPQLEKAKKILSGLVDVCHENDPTRPVTQALFRPNVSGDYTNGLADLLDVVGTNYRDNELLAAQRAKPSRKIIGTEQRHDRETWLNLRDHPSHAGQFLWTGVDYLGESRRWPLVGHASGLLDRTGAVKPMAFERQSWWSAAPMLRLARRVAHDDVMPTDPGYGGPELHTQVQFADWSPRNVTPHDENVEAYSNCEEVELFLNGQSLGVKKINANAAQRVWPVPFASGTLKAVARNGGKVAATDELRSAGKPARIRLNADGDALASGWDHVAFITATVVDENNVPVPSANDLITFTISGPGTIAAVDSADNASHEPFRANERRAFQGRCVAILKATAPTGKIKLTAAAPGRAPATLDLLATAAP